VIGVDRAGGAAVGPKFKVAFRAIRYTRAIVQSRYVFAFAGDVDPSVGPTWH